MVELSVLCEPAEPGCDEDALRRRLEHALHAETGPRMAVRLLATGSVPRSEGKAVRVVDRRPG